MWLRLWILEDNGPRANKVYYANFAFNSQIRSSWWNIKLSKFGEKCDLISVFVVLLDIVLEILRDVVRASVNFHCHRYWINEMINEMVGLCKWHTQQFLQATTTSFHTLQCSPSNSFQTVTSKFMFIRVRFGSVCILSGFVDLLISLQTNGKLNVDQGRLHPSRFSPNKYLLFILKFCSIQS